MEYKGRKMNRRGFVRTAGSAAAVAAVGGSGLLQACSSDRNDELNILCWEGYNTERVLGVFRSEHIYATVRAESGFNDTDMISRLHGGEIRIWDLININQPWAREQLFPEGLIKPLNKERFLPYFDLMMDEFKGPYPYSLDTSGTELLGMPQRFGPFNFVVNTDKVSRYLAEEQGFEYILRPLYER